MRRTYGHSHHCRYADFYRSLYANIVGGVYSYHLAYSYPDTHDGATPWFSSVIR